MNTVKTIAKFLFCFGLATSIPQPTKAMGPVSISLGILGVYAGYKSIEIFARDESEKPAKERIVSLVKAGCVGTAAAACIVSSTVLMPIPFV